MSGLREKDRDGGGTDAGVPRVLVVWCPDWPVVATDPEAGPAGPVAVVDGGKVLACSNAARTAGVRRGQRLRLAQRLCPELTLRERDVEAEIRRFEPVVAAVEAFTPRVEVLRPGLCAIPVKGPSRYFGGEEALAARVHAAVAAALTRSLREPPPAAGPDGPAEPADPPIVLLDPRTDGVGDGDGAGAAPVDPPALALVPPSATDSRPDPTALPGHPDPAAPAGRPHLTVVPDAAAPAAALGRGSDLPAGTLEASRSAGAVPGRASSGAVSTGTPAVLGLATGVVPADAPAARRPADGAPAAAVPGRASDLPARTPGAVPVDAPAAPGPADVAPAPVAAVPGRASDLPTDTPEASRSAGAVPADAPAASGPADAGSGSEVAAVRSASAEPARCHLGVADGLFAAVLAARVGALVPLGRTAEFLAPYPVAALGDEELADLLSRLGVHTVGVFAALSGTSVADRFGPTGIAAHRLARGLNARPLAPRPEGPDLGAEQLFDPPEESSEPLVFVARMLADQVHVGLAAVGLACQRVSVEVSCAGGRTAARLWRHEGSLTAAALAERVRWQLQAWQSAGTFTGADGGFTALRLVPDGLVPDQGRQLALWGEAVAEDRVVRAVARVQALLGYAGLRQGEAAGGRSPAEESARLPWGESADSAGPGSRPGAADGVRSHGGSAYGTEPLSARPTAATGAAAPLPRRRGTGGGPAR
ncbi:hypothetical protein, partial [Kitasatospora cinereorecta]|uniref:Y-family DNA polymerase n=1 Tax=Kitasatospora cinereorecta TaxID=285560 RepID=UPI0031F772AD